MSSSLYVFKFIFNPLNAYVICLIKPSPLHVVLMWEDVEERPAFVFLNTDNWIRDRTIEKTVEHPNIETLKYLKTFEHFLNLFQETKQKNKNKNLKWSVVYIIVELKHAFFHMYAYIHWLFSSQAIFVESTHARR